MAINHAAIILIVCGVLAIAAILVATSIFLWLDRRRTRRIRQLTVTAKGKDRDVDTMPGEVAPTSMGPVPATEATPPEAYNSEVQLAEHQFPPPTYRSRRSSAYPTPPDSIQEYGIELSPPATPQVSIKVSKAPSSIPWGRQVMNGRNSTPRKPDDAPGPPAPIIKWQTSRDRVSLASARPASNKAAERSPSTTRTPDPALSPSLRTQPSSVQTAPFDLHDFPLPPIPIVTDDPQSAPPVLGTDRDRRRASTLYEPRESAYARRSSFVQGGSWQSPPPSNVRRQPKPRRAATAPMDGFEALRLARKGSHLDIPLSAMGGGNLDLQRSEMQRQRTS